MIKAMHMPTEFPQIIESNYGPPDSVLKDDLKLVLRHLKGPMRQRVPNLLGELFHPIWHKAGSVR
jgi:hypothetical protein